MFWILQKIINIFLFIRILYWMGFVSTVKSYIQVKSSFRILFNWSIAICKFLDVKFKKIPSEHQINTCKTIFLLNHRSQADFFLHPLILGGSVNFLSRKQVAFMLGLTSLFLTKIVWFFNRSGHIDIEKFNSWMDKKFSESPCSSLVVYPEGHRMYDTTSISKEKIKRGIINYAYSRKIPVQLVMTFGNENAFNEKKLKISYGEKITYKIGKIIDPKNYPQAKEFVNVVVDEFAKFFDEAYQSTISEKQFEDTTQNLYETIEFKKQ